MPGRAARQCRAKSRVSSAHLSAHARAATKIASADTKLTSPRPFAAAPRAADCRPRDRRKSGYVPALARGSAIATSRRGTSVAIGHPATRHMPRVLTNNAATPHYAPHCGRCQHPKGDVMQLVNTVKSFVRNEEGQDLLEYALLVALIALVAIAAVTAAGTSVSTIFNSIATKLSGAAGGGA
jgi:pilus assembly protein Flp/PilA